MKYMRWSYDDLMACPEDYLPMILEYVQLEASKTSRAAGSSNSSGRGRRR